MHGRGMRHGMGMARTGRHRHSFHLMKTSRIVDISRNIVNGLWRVGESLLESITDRKELISKSNQPLQLKKAGNNFLIGKTREQIGVLSKVRAIIDYDQCLKCGVCVSACSLGAIITVDDLPTVIVEVCNGCGKCLAICPVGAITIQEI